MRTLRFACGVLIGLGAWVATGCYDFAADRQACIEAGHCLVDGPADAGDGDDAGVPDAGGDDAGVPDAGEAIGVPLRPSGPYGSCDPGKFRLAEPVCRFGWCWENPLPMGETLRVIEGVGSDLWTAGAKGHVLRIAGCDISQIPPFVDATINDLQPRSAKTVYFTAGDAGIYKYGESGWVDVTPATNWGTSAMAIELDVSGDPFAGGLNGVVVTYPNSPFDVAVYKSGVPNGITDLARGSRLWALGVNNELYEGNVTLDATVAWNSRSPNAPAPLRDIFSQGDQVWGVGEEGAVVFRPDAGVSFSSFSQDAFKVDGTRVNLRRVRGDGTRVWLMGERGALFEWLGGSSFIPIAVSASGPIVRSTLWDAHMPANGTRFVVGGGGTVLLQESGVWRDLRFVFDSPTVEELYAVDGFRDVVWAAGTSGRLYCLREDRWHECQTNPDAKRAAIHGIALAGENRVFVGGPGGLLAEVTDTGWTNVGFTQADGGFVASAGGFEVHGVFSAGGDNGWAVGEYPDGGGLILTRADGGWHEHPAGIGQPALNAVHGRSADDVWIVGRQGTVLHLFPPNQIAPFSERAPGKNLRAVHVDEDGTAYIVGAETIIGIGATGAAKSPVALEPAPLATSFFDVTPMGDDTYIAVGEGGVVYRWSTTPNSNATADPSPTNNTLRGAWTDPVSRQVWLVGENGAILRYAPAP